jgi:large subunit ribosomal protein L13
MQKSFLAKPGEIEAKWWVVDAEGKVLGRVAREIAVRLMGKHKVNYTPHVDSGDFVVVLNCDKVTLSGNKWHDKRYTWFTGYTRLRSATAEERRESAPERLIYEAVRRMLPKNKLAFRTIKRLKLYTGTEHPHQAQMPEKLEV